MEYVIIAIGLAIIAWMYVAYLICIRIKRTSILSRYKVGSREYVYANRLFSTRRLIVGIAFAIILSANAALKIRLARHLDLHELPIIILLMLIISAVVLFIVYHIIKYENKQKL
jgi:hypothetical protein